MNADSSASAAAADAVSAPLDMLLTAAAFGPAHWITPRAGAMRLTAAMATHPRLVAGRGWQLLSELSRVTLGTSTLQPSRRDRRFADPGWTGNPLLRRSVQAYLAAAQTAESLVEEVGLEWADTERARFAVRNLVDALAPSNNPVVNPAAWKAAIDTGGVSALTGLRRLISDMVVAHLAQTGQQDRIAAVTLLASMLDQERAGLASAVIDERIAQAAAAASQARGYLDGRSLAEVFAWLRPNDLIWNYWVNTDLLGRPPPPFDILCWNADTTRMTAGLHRDFLQLAVANALAKPGGATMLGSPVDLSLVDLDSYLVAGIADHICPWQSCYRSTQMLGGSTRFVLSTSGHIAAMVNPPGKDTASYQLAKETPADPQGWLRQAETCSGSWWPDYTAWLAERCGPEQTAPRKLGGGGLTPQSAAPGTYVHDH